ncbi:MAG: hypothetical protein ABIR33_02205 [Pyrinomonadaceae bacterium]
MALVKLHKNPGFLVPTGHPKGLTGWNLAASTMGTIVYTHDTKGAIPRIFGARNGQAFTIFDQAVSEQNVAKNFYVALGTYEGTTQKFDTLNYLHQRQATLGQFGQTGIKTVDKIWGPISKIANYPETIGRFAVALGHGHATIQKKYFVALMSESKNGQTGHIMHNQLDITVVTAKGPATLADIVQQNLTMFQAKV